VSAVAHDAMIPLRYRITRRAEDVPGGEVFSWDLEPVGEAVAPPAPGQFNMLYAFGSGEVPISISAFAPTGAFVHTIRQVGGVTRAMAALEAGAEIGVRGPFGTAWPLDAARGQDVVFVAGGIGLAPLRPAIHAALVARADFGRLLVLYGARQPDDLLYRDELARWREQGVDVQVTVDRGDRDWSGHVGVVTRLIDRGGFDPDRAVAMLCGPEVMMRFGVRALERRGVPIENLHVSLERNMKCAIGYCGHCQLGGRFICRDGPVFRYDRVASLLTVEGL
jgi:NAD(P)H-flavin reductase